MSQTEMQGIDIQPFDQDASSQPEYTKLNLTQAQMMHTSALFQQLPSLLAADTLSKAYTIQLPPGAKMEDLMLYKDGTQGLSLRAPDGKFMPGHGSLASVDAKATMMGAFSIMSIATGQFYLTEINKNMTAINQKADRILSFLYGDKRAELTSELQFVHYAYQNYNAIMTNESQKTATLANIQEARKVAMKDVEFYLSELEHYARDKNIADLKEYVNDSLKKKDCLQMAIQLYSMSNVLEICYSQNSNAAYLDYMEDDTISYIDKCEKRLLSDLSAIQMRIRSFKPGPLSKVDKEACESKIAELGDSLANGDNWIDREPLREILQLYRKGSTYCLNQNGELYLKTA